MKKDTPGHKVDCTRGTEGKAVVIWTTIPFLQAAIPWEEGGKRRIAPAKCEGANGLFWERMCQVASAKGNHCVRKRSLNKTAKLKRLTR